MPQRNDKKPFFARFLESQEPATGGAPSAGYLKTLKYPSDNDEDWPHQ